MKIYFAGSIRGGSEDREIYHTLILRLQEFGEVLTEHVGDPELTNQGESTTLDTKIFQRDVGWIREADIIVAEVTMPSLGVGYELGLGESLVLQRRLLGGGSILSWRPAERRLSWDRRARSFRSCDSSSHSSKSQGPNRSRGSISRTTRYTCGRVIRGIFFPQSCCNPSRNAPPSRHMAMW